MKYRQWNDLPPAPSGALEAAGIPGLCARVLAARGVTDPAEAHRFLYEEAPLHDPMEMRDMDKAVSRLRQAIADGEPIAVYGDYDVDGITAASLLTLFLRGEGAAVLPYIPNRLEEGYGLNQGAMEKLAAQGAKLVVTVDCGITALEETRYAQSLGLDVIITDHHECKETLPPALAVVDPHRPDCPYPFKSLAGVGVSLKLCLALAGPERQGELLSAYADLAALGTVADVMSLTDENRTIVRRGLSTLPHTTRPGLLALLRESGAEGKALSSTLVGYTLAPRINAAGRMGCSEVALELLLTDDPQRGEELAQKLCSLNRQRQELEGDIFSQCDILVDSLPTGERDALVLAGDSWHQGVVGIVASRLTEKYACPAFMICLTEGRGKGSCRSYGNINLFALLEGCTDLLESFGGHELAAGFTILEENIPPFRQRINQLTRQARQEKPAVTTLSVDCVLPDPTLLTQEEVEALSLLEPYGPGNPKPIFRLDRCAVTGLTQVGNGKHMKLKLSAGPWTPSSSRPPPPKRASAPTSGWTSASPPRSTSTRAGAVSSSRSVTSAPPGPGPRWRRSFSAALWRGGPSPPPKPSPSSPPARSSPTFGNTWFPAGRRGAWRRPPSAWPGTWPGSMVSGRSLCAPRSAWRSSTTGASSAWRRPPITSGSTSPPPRAR